MKANKAPLSKYQWLVVAIIALTQFTVVLDFMVMSPLGDLLMKDLQVKPYQFGIVVSSYALAAGLSGFLTAGFADRFDRKRLLVFFYSGFIIGTLFCGLAKSYEQLVMARIFTGIFGGVMSSISMAIVADLFSLQQRGRVMGFMQMGFGLSQILGIPISLYIASQSSWQMPFYMIVGLSILMLMAILLALKPVRAHLDKKTDRSAFHHLLATIQNRNYRIGFMATAFMSLGGYFMMPWGSAFAVNNVGLSQKELPFLFMVVGVATFMIMPIIGILADKINKFKLFMWASIVMIVAVLVYVQLGETSLFVLIVVNIFMMGGIMARMVPSQALTSSVPELHDRGAFMSINASLQQIAGGIAAIIGGKIVWQASPSAPLMNFDLLGYVVVGVILINIYLTRRVYLYVDRKNKEAA
ncbi:MAG: MFS transporter [Crocinitomicaceae bacterium]|nr:MFS transporter [Crocinitomicaceae bacterium]MDP4724369.1 MFS transporter [Crocinitomicaceae bacterium]MDP4739495.1 MFS transporter [Crocinitomicaceae bacterium]MDP4799306.1 MFS transporter [Crocinitomicaceae bacterium]MDP4806760.1 MFS transporter [Crocinitomicaceae bacterium]